MDTLQQYWATAICLTMFMRRLCPHNNLAAKFAIW